MIQPCQTKSVWNCFQDCKQEGALAWYDTEGTWGDWDIGRKLGL